MSAHTFKRATPSIGRWTLLGHDQQRDTWRKVAEVSHYHEDAEKHMALLLASPDLLAAAKCAANVLALLSKEVEALGLRAGNVPQMLREAIEKAEDAS